MALLVDGGDINVFGIQIQVKHINLELSYSSHIRRIYLSLFQNTNYHFTPETPSDTPNKIENEGEECWDNCSRLQGGCPWCGSEGMCCRVANGNANRVGNGCDGYIGGRNRHECTLASGGTGGNNVAKIYDSNFLIKFFSTFLRSYKSNYMTF